MACIKDYSFKMNIMEENFQTRSCIEILANDCHNTIALQFLVSTTYAWIENFA